MGGETEKPMETPKTEAMRSAARLLRRGGTGALSVLDAKTQEPFVTMVNTAVDAALHPLILISALSLHTQNLKADPRASLLLHDDFPDGGDPQTALRVTLSGRFAPIAYKTEAEAAGQAFLARHPYAELYAGFGDFLFWRMEPTRAHIVAGFGRAYDVRFQDIAALG